MPKKYRPYLFLLLFSIPLFFINVHEQHNWGDDFAQYIKEADNFAKGKPFYETTTIYNHLNPVFGPPQYPPGFPLILSPIIKIWGLSVRAMNYFMSFLLACLLFTLYGYYRKYTSSAIAVCLSLLCVYSVEVIDLKSSILSDIPAWLFVALYFLLRHTEHFSGRRIIALTAIATMAILTRSQYMLIPAAEGAYLLLLATRQWKNDKRINLEEICTSPSAKIICGTALLFLLLNNFIFDTPSSTLGFYQQLASKHAVSFWDTVGSNAGNILELLVSGYQYRTSDTFLNVITRIVAYMLFAFAVIGYITLIKKRLDAADVFFMMLLLFFCCFSQNQDMRYIIASLHFYLLYAFIGMRRVLPSLLNIRGRKPAIIFTAIYFVFGYNDFEIRSRKAVDPISNTLFPEDKQAFHYIRKNIKDNEPIIFEKSRCLALFTGKQAVTIAPKAPVGMNRRFFDSLDAKYLLTCNDFADTFYRKYLQHIPAPADTEVIAPGYTLYRLR